MRSNSVIYLTKVTQEYDEIGNSRPTKTKRMVFANKYQVSASEFYSENINYKAKVHSTRAKGAFQIRTSEYKGETEFIYNNVTHDILRISDNGEYTLIVGVEKIGNN